MANSCIVLTNFGPVALGLDALLASKDFGPDKDILDTLSFLKCNHYVLIVHRSGGTGFVQNWPIFGNNFLFFNLLP